MNRALLPDMLHSKDMTVPERQRARLKWQQEQQILHQQQILQQQLQQHQEGYFGDWSSAFQVQQQQGFQGGEGLGDGGGLSEMVTLSTTSSVNPEQGLVDNGWLDFLGFGSSGGYGNNNNGTGLEFNDAAISRTSSCQPMVAEAAAAEKDRVSLVSGKVSSGVGTESFKRRKVDDVNNNAQVVAEDETRDKRIRGFQEEGESKITEKTSNKSSNGNNNKSSKNNKPNNSSSSNKENSAETSKDNSKVTEVQKPDYIHVRARRGQATDSHSLAERVRREKISERMKYLQDLVPGCNKTTGKAGMLDEIINYVQSLQRQVEFLSMKLAAVNPRLDFNIDNLLAKEVFATHATSFPTIGMSSVLANPAYHHFNPAQQPVVACGLDMGMNASDMELKRTISAPVSIPEPFLETSCFTQIQPSSNWNVDLQSLYNVAFDQGRSTTFPSQPFTGTGPLDAGNLKMEM